MFHVPHSMDMENLLNCSYKQAAPYFELDAYKAQMQHSSWNNATSEFQNYMLGNTEGYLNQLKESNNSATQKRYQDYVKFFNSKK